MRLPPKPLALLTLLLERAGEVVSKDEMLRAVWPETVVSDAALASCVQELRQALRDDARAPRYIETLHRRGYRFIARSMAASSPGALSRVRQWSRRPGEPGSTNRRPPHARDGGDDLPLIGRAAEIDQLIALDRASAGGRLHVVVIFGEAGVGKTRLVGEIADRFDRHGGRILVGRAHESEQIVPYGPWIAAINASAVLADAMLPSALPPGCRAALARLFPDFSAGDSLAGPEHHRTLFEALAVLLRRIAERPLLVVLEDLHWADEMTVRLVPFLARRLRDTPVLCVATVREEEIAGSALLGAMLDELQVETSVVRLPLPPLSRPETMALAQRVARAGAAVGDAVLQAVWRASEGNPLVAIETMRGLDDGVVSPAGEQLSVAPRIQELITARLERLPARVRGLALTAAVIGRPFELAVVRHASGLAEPDAAEAVDALVQRRVLRATGNQLQFSRVEHQPGHSPAYARHHSGRTPADDGRDRRAQPEMGAPRQDAGGSQAERARMDATASSVSMGFVR